MSKVEDDEESGGGGTTPQPRRTKTGKHARRSGKASGSGSARRSGGRASSGSGGAKRARSSTSDGERAASAGAGTGVSTRASVWPHAASHTGAAGTPALELVTQANPADAGLLDALLELVGTEHLTLGHALAAWQREQDRLANRAWRRPGGLARPAGL